MRVTPGHRHRAWWSSTQEHRNDTHRSCGVGSEPITGRSNTSSTARRSALDPSSTARIGRVTSRPALAQPDDQLGDQGGVLGRALDQRQRVLDPVDVDPEGDHAGVLAEVHPVDHQRHQVQRRKVRGEQLGQRGLGLGDEPPRHRRARGAGGGLLGARPDRFEPNAGSGASTARRASGPAPSAPAPRWRRTAHRPPPAAHRSRRRRASAAARPGPGARPGSPTRARGRAGSPSARSRGGPSARTPRSRPLP